MPAAAKPLKIALICDWFSPRLGGIETQLADLARHLEKRGHTADVLTTTPGPDISDGVRVIRIDTPRLPFSDLSISPRLTQILTAELRRGGYDVAHAHFSVISPAALAGARAAVRLGIPVVMTFHSVLLRAVPALRFLDRITRWSRAPVLLTAVSQLVAGQVSRAAGGREVLVLPNGVEPELWSRAALPASNEPVVVSAMRLNLKKRPFSMLRAFAEAIAGGKPARLIIAGSGPQRHKMEAEAARLGLAGRVEFAGAIPHKDLAPLYRRADIFISSSNRESFCIAALEARCAGLAVAAMRPSGSCDFLTDGQTALLADDDAALTANLRRLIEDPVLRARLGTPDAGLARFAWPEIARAHEAMYGRAAALLSAAGQARSASGPGQTGGSPA